MMWKNMRSDRLLPCAAIVSALVLSQILITPVLGYGPRENNGQSQQNQEQYKYQSRNQNAEQHENQYQYENFSDVEDMLSELDIELDVSGLGLGHEFRLRLREIFAAHKQAMEEIRLRRRLFNQEMKQNIKELISEFNQTRAEIRERVRLAFQQIEALRQRFRDGTITEQEFRVQVDPIRVEIKTDFNLMLKLGKEIGSLGKEVALKNREFAHEILKANVDFKNELMAFLNRAREVWSNRNRGHP